MVLEVKSSSRRCTISIHPSIHLPPALIPHRRPPSITHPRQHHLQSSRMEKVPFLREETHWDGSPSPNILSPRTWPSPYAMSRAPRPNIVRAVACIGILLILLIISTLVGSSSPTRESLGVYNSTLGFGAIILMSLADRTDRQDAVSLIASTSGVEITKLIAATRGEEVIPKARPFGKANMAEGYWGSWRTHLNALKYVVDNRIETALLFEDDVDWDVRIKPQLEAFSKGLKASPLRNRSSTPVSTKYPYGMDWDIMHLGPVWVKLAPSPYEAVHARYTDPLRPAEAGCPGIHLDNKSSPLFCWDPLLELLDVPPSTRAILPSANVVGLPAVAVTYEGAQRLLFELSWNVLDNTLDWSIEQLLVHGRIRGWTVMPPLFSMFKVGGNADSDISGAGKKSVSNLGGVSHGLERSARLALEDAFGAKSRLPNRWSREYWDSRGVQVTELEALKKAS